MIIAKYLNIVTQFNPQDDLPIKGLEIKNLNNGNLLLKSDNDIGVYIHDEVVLRKGTKLRCLVNDIVVFNVND